MKRALLPLGLFLVLAVFLAIGLNRDPREVPSPLIDKPAPMFSLPQLAEPGKTLSPADLRGKVWLFNVWASWCVSCRIEHPLLVDLAKQGQVTLIGLNYKDQRDDALGWLTQHGDPYQLSVSDTEGLVGIDYGVYGVPETFIVDKYGVIRHKHIGPITPESLRDEILPWVARLEQEGA